MNYWAAAIIAALCGAIVGYLQTFVFAKIPEKWLQDYGVKETDPDFRLSKRMKLIPHGVLSALFCASIYTLFVVFCYEHYIATLAVFHIFAVMAVTPIIVIVMMSDRLNRIIPDECSIAIAVIGVLSAAGDFFENDVWFSDSAAWYIPLLNRIIAAIVGGGILWLINFLCITFLGKEGMGQGDMKLLAACGLLTGCYGLIVVIYIGIIVALFFAVPLLVKKYMRKAQENKEIANAENPAEKRREIAKRKAQIHFADDPDYLAFGPFLALGAAVYLALEPFFASHLLPSLELLGLAF
ncbi:MAG: A24 family peptidase [Saccharofermentans sp.]|nr:A24 family peptidase [Saccharofermentans sp.]